MKKLVWEPSFFRRCAFEGVFPTDEELERLLQIVKGPPVFEGMYYYMPEFDRDGSFVEYLMNIRDCYLDLRCKPLLDDKILAFAREPPPEGQVGRYIVKYGNLEAGVAVNGEPRHKVFDTREHPYQPVGWTSGVVCVGWTVENPVIKGFLLFQDRKFHNMPVLPPPQLYINSKEVKIDAFQPFSFKWRDAVIWCYCKSFSLLVLFPLLVLLVLLLLFCFRNHLLKLFANHLRGFFVVVLQRNPRLVPNEELQAPLLHGLCGDGRVLDQMCFNCTPRQCAISFGHLTHTFPEAIVGNREERCSFMDTLPRRRVQDWFPVFCHQYRVLLLHELLQVLAPLLR